MSVGPVSCILAPRSPPVPLSVCRSVVVSVPGHAGGRCKSPRRRRSQSRRLVGAACRRRPQRRYITASRAAAARRPARQPRSSLLLYIAVDEGRISVAVTATAAFPSRLVQSESMHRAAVQVDCQFAIVVKHFPRIWNGLPACHIFTNISTKTESTLFFFDDLTRTLCCSPVVSCGPSFGLLRFSGRPLAGLICTVHPTGCTTGCKV